MLSCTRNGATAVLMAMQMFRHEISPRQMRGLLLLLVLVPLIPTVLMLRFMIEVVESEQEAARERLSEVYRQSLGTAVSSLAGHFKGRTAAQAETRQAVVEYFQRTFDP